MNAYERQLVPYEPAPVLAHYDANPFAADAADKLDLLMLLTVLRRRYRILLLCLGIGAAAAMIFTARQTPVYSATARVMINSRDQQVAPTEDKSVLSALPNSDAAVDSEVQVIGSRSLARQAALRLKLLQPAQVNDSTPQTAGVVDGLLSGLSVRRLGETYAIDISYVSADPTFAAQAANAFAATYIDQQVAEKFAASHQATSFLATRIEELRLQALSDAAAVQQYRISNNLPSTQGASLTEQEISVYNQQVAQARAESAAADARLQTARRQLAGGSSGDDVGEALDSGVIQNLRARRADASGRLAALQGRYGPRHPDRVKTERELADIDAQIQSEIGRVISNLEAQSEVARRRLTSISGSLQGARSTLIDNNRANVRLGELEQKAAASQALYESYLNRYKQTSAQEGTEQPDAKLLSEARKPGAPASPRPMLNLAFGLLAGVGLGLVFVILAELMDNTLTTAQDVYRRLGLRCLTGVPLLSSVDKRRNAKPIETIVDHPHSAFAEAYRSLRAALTYAGGPATVIALASALPGEGKTTSAICLARTAALQGQRVLLIDAELRRRQVSKVMGQTRSEGLVEVLTGACPLERAMTPDSRTKLMVLGAGAAALTHEDVLGSVEMDKLLEEVRKSFDLVVIDTPPILPVADGRVLAAKADVTLLVARWRRTSDHAISAALRLLPSEGVNLAGVVLNAIDVRKQMRFGVGDPAYFYRSYERYYA